VRSKQSAWELSGKFEGDIALSGAELRNGLIAAPNRWPDRTVPYVIDGVFSEYPTELRAMTQATPLPGTNTEQTDLLAPSGRSLTGCRSRRIFARPAHQEVGRWPAGIQLAQGEAQ
jgi:hypothetical protein